MCKRAIAVFLSTYFFLASTLLPKGDFALMADLHDMYQQYTRIDDPKEVGIIDFVVDYLLNGEALSGGDMYKGKPIPYQTVQFQHQANFANVILIQHGFIKPAVKIFVKKHLVVNDRFAPEPFTRELLRPPVAC
ncbi:hypothetical protein MUY27_19470 [Mucilaginibacter sp. RS28]|uniref:Uncharacterized protein n=1 Tax=Mucilaginibacter straminoryzae TaxID=2932774 RepID=A0A9X2BDB9_9SPHI|nr:hypothetical protein [Mucilaginibacter straminoryzae]MCJ8211907.1 hypothetical protein [Mucilaginibacter straminoryzae]